MKPIVILFLMLTFISCHQDNVVRHIQESDDFMLADTALAIKLVASDPIINAPIALDIDDKGRIWVLEMPDYMPDIDGAEEDNPQGRIVILSDPDGDGYHDQAKVFMDGLHHPRAMRLAYGGLLYATPPNLYFVDIHDDQPGDPILVDSLYAVGGNIEHQPNSLIMNIDNWMYNAKSQFRYRRMGNHWLKEPTTFRGQWGISHDAYGRLYYNDNSNGLYGDFVLPNTVILHQHITDPEGVTNNLLLDRSIQPAHSTSVNRGYLDYMLDSNQIVKTMTSTCSPLVYASTALGLDYVGNGFICVPEGNLIKRVSIKNDRETQEASNIYQNTEWLRSTDEGFRPVNLHHALDGSIYVVDMHRGVIQHNTYMTDYLRSEILEKKLDTIVGQGRIYKIHAKEQTKKHINFTELSTEELIQLLDDSNILIRKKAQQFLISKKDQQTSFLIYESMQEFSEIGKIHSLYTLEGLGLFDASKLQKHVSAQHPWFNSHLLVTLSHDIHQANQDVALSLIQQILDLDPTNLYLGFALGKISNPQLQDARKALYQQFAEKNTSKLAAQMILAGAPVNDKMVHTLLHQSANKKYNKQVSKIEKAIADHKVHSIYKKKDYSIKDKTLGRSLYISLCASCHNSDGRGIEHLAPSLKASKILEAYPLGVVATILNGLQGPVTIDGEIEKYTAFMPGLKENKELTDEKISRLTDYIFNSFRSRPSKVTEDHVRQIRKLTKDEVHPMTEAEVIELVKQLPDPS